MCSAHTPRIRIVREVYLYRFCLIASLGRMLCHPIWMMGLLRMCCARVSECIRVILVCVCVCSTADDKQNETPRIQMREIALVLFLSYSVKVVCCTAALHPNSSRLDSAKCWWS